MKYVKATCAILLAATLGMAWMMKPDVVPAQSAAAQPGPNDSFYTTQSKLDPGGSMYIYLDLQDLLGGLIEELHTTFAATPGMEQAAAVLGKADQVIERLGLDQMEDIGFSLVDEGDTTLSRCFISMPPDRPGLARVLGGDPHPFETLTHAPEDTLVFATGDVDLAAALDLVREVALDVAGPQALQGLNAALVMFQGQAGLNLEAMIRSLAGELTIMATVDPSSKVDIPSRSGLMQFDSPHALVMARVKDSTIYDALRMFFAAREMAGPDAADGGLRLTKLLLPFEDGPWDAAPVIATDGRFFYAASHESYLRRVLATPASGVNLGSTEEFQRLSQGLPLEGNGLSFAGQRFMDIYGEFMTKVSEEAKEDVPGWDIIMGRVREMLKPGLKLRVHEPDGILMVSRSELSPRQIMTAMALAPAAMMGAITVPNFIEAKHRSKRSRVMADMRTLGIALEAYNIDTNQYAAWSAEPSENPFGPYADSYPQYHNLPTFRLRQAGNNLMTLTTPISYVTEYMTDPFGPIQGPTFAYWTPPPPAIGWIMWSPGLDGVHQLTLDNIGQAYDPSGPVPSPYLIERAYDPTNGTVSGGDVYRFMW